MNRLLKFLNAPSPDVPQDQIFPLTELMMAIYRLRPDLHSGLNISYYEGRKAYINWLFNGGIKETIKNDIPVDTIGGPEAVFGVNILGYSKAQLGIGEDARMTAKALDESGTPTSIFPISLDYRDEKETDDRASALVSNFLPYPINIFNLPGMNQFQLLFQYGDQIFRERYNIGFWPWELERWPDQLKHCLSLNDEIWAISEFTKNSLTPYTQCSVHVMPQTLEFDPPGKLDLAAYGCQSESYKFLFVFDFNSYIHRKNPHAAIKAFHKAFPKPDGEKVELVLKTMWGQENSPEWKDLIALIEGDSRVRIMNCSLSKNDVLGLMNTADCFISLHRSEGFGRCIAESMLLKKPCIVTGYSGNMDYCTPQNSLIVDFERVRVKPREYHFIENEENFWAEPSIEHAAVQMRKVFNDRELGARLGENGFTTIRDRYNSKVTALAYNERVKTIFQHLQVKPKNYRS